ncbi:hypothetical protein [Streptacidiphilus sp. PAMC 29251]
MRLFRSIAPTAAEVGGPLPGDHLVPDPDVVMDRAFTLPAPPELVRPWIVQLGKHRSGWYLPRSAERLVPPRRRALRRIEPALQRLAVGDVIPDWGGRHETFEVALLQPPHTLVHRSLRGATAVSWAIILVPMGQDRTRVQLRLRLDPVKHRWLARSGGGFVDLVTVAGLAAGLRERLSDR